MTSMFALWAGTLLAFWGPVTEVTITPMASMTSVLISADENVQYRAFTMEGPHRLVVDLIGASHALPQDEFAEVNRGGILSVRSSQYSEEVVRVVFVLDGELGYTVVPDPRGLRISLENRTGDFEPWSSGATAPFDPTTLVPATAVAPVQEARRFSVTWIEMPK